MHILGLCGSLRRNSYNRQLLVTAAGVLPEGGRLELFDALERIPPFNEDHEEDVPAPVQWLRRRIGEADAVLIATPEYNSSPPGHLKNALDWASRPRGASVIREKPVAVIGASTSQHGASRAQAELRKVLKSSGARVVEGEVAIGRAHERFMPDGWVVESQLRDTLAELLARLVGAEPTTTALRGTP